MTARAFDARKAADARDKQAVFDTGGRLYETCIACHEAFVIGPPASAKPLPDFPADVPSPELTPTWRARQDSNLQPSA